VITGLEIKLWQLTPVRDNAIVVLVAARGHIRVRDVWHALHEAIHLRLRRARLDLGAVDARADVRELFLHLLLGVLHGHTLAHQFADALAGALALRLQFLAENVRALAPRIEFLERRRIENIAAHRQCFRDGLEVPAHFPEIEHVVCFRRLATKKPA
jgi:hypothetical protein